MKKKLLTLTTVIALVAVVALVFTACFPADATKAKEKLEKAGYEVTVFNADDAVGSLAIKATEEGFGVTGIESMVSAFKGSLLDLDESEDFVLLYYFDTAENAKAAYDKIVEEEVDEEDEENFEYGRSGKIIYAGTAEAVKAVK